LIDPESRVLWKRRGSDGCYTVRIDDKRVYHANGEKLSAYDRVTGKRLWQKRAGSVLFGWQTEHSIYVGTLENKVIQFRKDTGQRQQVYACDDAIAACATTPDGRVVFAGEGGDILAFDSSGNRLWKLPTDCGESQSMQYHDGLLYAATHGGYLACIDLSESAIQAALAGEVVKPREVKAGKGPAITVTRELETTSSSGKGVVLECVAEGSALRIRVVSKGYHRDWNVQFPRDVRELGAKYVVEEVREATQGGFYRARGKIRKLVPASATSRRRS